jgi:hypothetical protein
MGDHVLLQRFAKAAMIDEGDDLGTAGHDSVHPAAAYRFSIAGTQSTCPVAALPATAATPQRETLRARCISSAWPQSTTATRRSHSIAGRRSSAHASSASATGSSDSGDVRLNARATAL